jgi:hypothetical protein
MTVTLIGLAGGLLPPGAGQALATARLVVGVDKVLPRRPTACRVGGPDRGGRGGGVGGRAGVRRPRVLRRVAGTAESGAPDGVPARRVPRAARRVADPASVGRRERRQCAGERISPGGERLPCASGGRSADRAGRRTGRDRGRAGGRWRRRRSRTATGCAARPSCGPWRWRSWHRGWAR